MLNWKRIASLAIALTLVAAAGCSSEESAKKDSDSMDKAKQSQTSEEKSAEKEAEESGKKEAEKTAEKSSEMSKEKSGDTKKMPVKGGSKDVELAGYCPVAYKMAGKPIKGKKEFAVKQDGKTYYLANEKAMKAFKKSPDKYGVKFNGWCATGLAMGKQVSGDPSIFMVHEGSVYLFSSKKAKKKFKSDPAKMAKKAGMNYMKMTEKGSSAEADKEMSDDSKEESSGDAKAETSSK
jgi:YHS domain-containing protein